MRELPSDRPSTKELSKKLRSHALPPPPEDWLIWLRRTKRVEESTIKIYSHHIGQLFGFAQLLFPSIQPSLLLAWNVRFCQEFLDTIAHLVAPSTFQNYYSTFTNVRRYLWGKGPKKRPENWGEIDEEFKSMRSASDRKKKRYEKKRKTLLLEANTNLLKVFYRDVCHNERLWNVYGRMVQKSQYAIKKKKRPAKFSRGHLYFANGFLISLLQSSNFKRSGNYSEIKCAEARKELEEACTEFERKFPGKEFAQDPEKRRLDRKYCVPAVLKAENGRKKGEVEWFVILNPSIILALLWYIDYIRPFSQQPPKTDALFVNSWGECLGYNVTR